MTKNKSADESTTQQRYIVEAPLVIKYFTKKNGQKTDAKEVYIRRSIQDYFVKFCESEVNLDMLSPHLPTSEFDIKTLKMEIEIREGEWDICDDNFDQQSRIGKYAIIHRIFQPETK